MKNGDTVVNEASVPASAPVIQPEQITAVLVEHVTKRFVIGRKKKSVVAINDVSLRIQHGEGLLLPAGGRGLLPSVRITALAPQIEPQRLQERSRVVRRYGVGEVQVVDGVPERVEMSLEPTSPLRPGRLLRQRVLVSQDGDQ